ncbi:related to response regulator Mcs4 [Rhynchosporium secalis]|uniref:Related to response regulator Mcs4 n=1 Tax=Rhynchosporium secalis TaxID=38038 RepID=A0A1E1MH38_RHYSE|nr:related to response regulator Mcs4 [Rhynchosporium secalis]
MAIGDLTTRLRAAFTRRHSNASSFSQKSTTSASSPGGEQSRKARSVRSRASHKIPSLRGGTTIEENDLKEREPGSAEVGNSDSEVVAEAGEGPRDLSRDAAGQNLTQQLQIQIQGTCSNDRREIPLPSTPPSTPPPTASPSYLQPFALDAEATLDDSKQNSLSTADFPTPNTDIFPVPEEDEDGNISPADSTTGKGNGKILVTSPGETTTIAAAIKRPAEPQRRQSLLPHQQTTLIKTLLETELPPQSNPAILDYFANNGPSTISGNMVSRKIWVKRPAASATLVTIHEDDLVDDVRDMILKKYANSLGRNFDAPDVTLRIIPREQRQERTLGPEEPMGRTLDAYFPGGQTVDEALVIDVPVKRTPKPSPQPQRIYYDELRPTENGSDYFPPMPPAVPSPHLPHSVPTGVNGQNAHHPLTAHSMSVLTTGHVPALPSPGGSSRRHHSNRPRIGRQHTSSPSVIGSLSQQQQQQQPSLNNDKSSAPPVAPPLPSPPAPQTNDLGLGTQVQRVATPPPPRVHSPRPQSSHPKKSKKAKVEHPSLPAGMLNGGVPPINVLIVEDNIINLKLLEAFMKRLKVRWQTAMNGREAVNKWRAGGFHLVLMDIQLPIMSGLEATKEIRRLERLNSIGVFSSSASSSAPETGADEPEGEDKLPSTVLFKSPVIIVALTASSLQSDRHEALAAGCNDFLTKPVNFVWLERKVMEWGCMQALIDFDGWRKWKDFSQQADTDDKNTKSAKLSAANKKKKNRSSLGANPGGSTSRLAIQEETEGEEGK